MLDTSALMEIILNNKPEYLLVGSTARKSKKFSILPNRTINNMVASSILITDQYTCNHILGLVDGKVPVILADIEGKQDVNIFASAKKVIRHSRIIPYKPNDMTLEAADVLLNKHFNYDLINKNILIFGTGNLAGKLALRLSERNASVTISGRNQQKASQLANLINILLPKFSHNTVKAFTHNKSDENQFDALVSFVSAERVLNSNYFKYLTPDALVVDGGINNLSEELIELKNHKDLSIIRLDTRIGLPFVESFLNAFDNDFFQNVVGEKKIDGVNCVAGGIIGSHGDIILDNISSPTQVIGVANGLGGLKDEGEYNSADKRQLSILQQRILSDN
ncbi:NAD(P)-binding domain-containing protein [Mangrovibacillus sp. Mu-81]|uniref:NAD(P)-binding domain-containing protein n=1 Tax=Mangrovibacillus sp. Mu-81 TaxID=3121478 RepID=UPI002FE4D487